MATPFIFVPFLTLGKVKAIEFFIKNSVLALKQIMFFCIPVVFAFASAILIKAFFQAMFKKKNHETKLTFISGIIWLILGVFLIFAFKKGGINDFWTVSFSSLSIVFAIIIPVVVALIYLYSLIFCCNEATCHRRILSHHPPIFVKIALFVYLALVGFYVFRVLEKTKLIHFVSRVSCHKTGQSGLFKSLIKRIAVKKSTKKIKKQSQLEFDQLY